MSENAQRPRPGGAGRRLAPWLGGAAIVASGAMMVACGDSSDDSAKGSATTKAAAAQPAATEAAPATAATPASSAAPASDAPKVSPKVKAWNDAGTMRLAAVRIGTPGKIEVEPRGNVDHWDHYYPKGTVVTVTAKNTKTARFMEWTGACSGKKKVCKVTMTGLKRVLGGFALDAEAAKGLSPDDPALKGGVGG